MEKVHIPLSFYLDDFDESFALIFLNTPIEKNDNVVKQLFKKASFKVLVDGGANRMFDVDSETGHFHIPDMITGDLDSARSDVLKFYREKGVEIIETYDQNFTDFTKCLKIVLEKIEKKELNVKYILVHVGIRGRFDQVMGNIQTLYHMVPKTNIPIYLISRENIIFLLLKGSHRIMLNQKFNEGYCGLLPIGRSCDNVTTTGLKWNLTHDKLEFGKLVSTSNKWIPESDDISIVTDEPLIFTMSFNEN
ncbi:DgyrCDS4730 [Dimorphilus gyrociliatus]|uniref:Thiamine pyrophosphokinase n=1 Tax=Dimorphilus gyrociliatus TaxID=2664684 RepID=A0A7I8VIC2_9ANNE|nr:DgyrCDS4730 [Dimorphilus gyrociliatus]